MEKNASLGKRKFGKSSPDGVLPGMYPPEIEKQSPAEEDKKPDQKTTDPDGDKKVG